MDFGLQKRFMRKKKEGRRSEGGVKKKEGIFDCLL
jgi:hypothetical protein